MLTVRISDEFAEVGGLHRHWHAAQVGEPRLELRIGKARKETDIKLYGVNGGGVVIGGEALEQMPKSGLVL